MWIELSTDSLDDWKEAIRICGIVFAKTHWFTRAGLDVTTTKKFTRAYFQYIYEVELSGGKGALVSVKTRRTNGSIGTAYVAAFVYNRAGVTLGNKAPMEQLAPQSTVDILKGDAWDEENIHDKVQAWAKSMQYCYIYAVFDAVAPEFAGNRIGTTYMDRCVDIAYADGVRRGLLPRSQPCFLYGIIDDPKSAGISRGERREVAHLHQSLDSVCLRSKKAPVGVFLTAVP